MPFSSLHHALETYLPIIIKHPFNQALLHGHLPPSVFNLFIQQDKHYLTQYALALSTIAYRLEPTHQKHAMQFHQFANAIKQSEITMHRHYLISQTHTRFFKPKPTHANSALTAYIHHLHACTQMQPIAVAIAAVLPCFVIYRELGVNMPRHAEHPYYTWIKTYSSPRFLKNTDSMMMVFKAHNHPDLNEEAVKSFTTSIAHELNFWDSVIKTQAQTTHPSLTHGKYG